jgi:hypothetical protein
VSPLRSESIDPRQRFYSVEENEFQALKTENERLRGALRRCSEQAVQGDTDAVCHIVREAL